jgi:hypothetical protein
MKPCLAHARSPFRRTTLRWTGAGLAVLLCLPLCTGCNKGGTPAGKGAVTGKVTLGDKGVGPNANVAFFGADDKQVSEATTTGEGDYIMPNVPVGPVKIAVFRRMPVAKTPPPQMAGMPTPAPELAIPGKYSQPSSGLTYTVTQGQQKHNIELTP